jgi:hypothetical protein
MEILQGSFNDIVELSKNRKEGIVILGAGGDPQDWVKGIPEHLLGAKVSTI